MDRPMTSLSVDTLPPNAWPEVSAQFRDLTYEQSLTYAGPAADRIGAEAEFVTLTDDTGRIVAAACLRIKRVPGLGRGIAWIASGPLVCPKDQPEPDADRLRAVFAALGQYAQKTGHILRLRFAAPSGLEAGQMDQIAVSEGFGITQKAGSYRTVLIDCTPDEETLMAALHGKWRNPLRNALKAEIELEYLPLAECTERFDRLYREVQAAKGFDPDIPPEFYYALDGPDFTHEVLIARKDGADIAAMTIGHTGQNAVYLFGATSELGRRLNAGHFLMWQATLRCRELGRKCFDLGGIDPDTNPSVTRFKQRTGGADVTACGPYEYRPSGLAPTLVGAAEALHSRLKGRK